MKTKLLLIINLLATLLIYAQSKDYGLIKYVHQDNLLSVEYKALLAIDGRKSYYVTAQDSLGERGKINQYGNNTILEADNYGNLRKTRKDGFEVYNDLSNQNIFFSNALSLNAPLVYVQEKRPNLNWKLMNDSKVVAGFKCKAASTVFRGRTYTCWYTMDIPLPYGPWKLMGLPGIILEASSDDGAFKVIAVEIDFATRHSLVPSSETELLNSDNQFYPLESYIKYQRKFIQLEKESMRLSALKYNVTLTESKESDNYLEIFGK